MRIAAALLLLAGLAGAAASAARRESLATFRADLDAGRVTEVILAGPGSYLPPGAATDSGRFGRTVRWEVTGGGRRVAIAVGILLGVAGRQLAGWLAG